MTSMPESRSARAMTLAPRSCPSRPGLAMSTRIGRSMVARECTRSGPQDRKPLSHDAAGLGELAAQLLLDGSHVSDELVVLAFLVLDPDRRQNVARALTRPRVTLPHDRHHFIPVPFEAGAARSEIGRAHV